MPLFAKKINIYAPANGKLIELEYVPDEMFAKKMLGDGFAVEPKDGFIHCPISGKVVMVSENGYAFGIRSKSGVELLVHIGIDTVNLQGKGFKCLLKEGQNVQATDIAVELDMDYLKQQPYPVTTMVVITSGEQVEHLKREADNITFDEIIATA
ncbi:MAG: PTS glucose transporter subunit IIA [Erysipelotrichia bacterium]|nr:PTS glucose transporter subunit IIA [Erysipelotrichia bacterium]